MLVRRINGRQARLRINGLYLEDRRHLRLSLYIDPHRRLRAEASRMHRVTKIL
jgi:hypothetical protein